MGKLADLLTQRAALEQAIDKARKEEIEEAIATIRHLVAQFALTPADVFPTKDKKTNRRGSSVKPKYRHPETGETWTGRGRAPKWIEGKERELFLIST